MRRHRLPPTFLLVLPWIASAVPAVAQVSRSTQVMAPVATQSLRPSTVGTATLAGLEQLSLSPGAKAFVKATATTSLPKGPISGSLYRYEQRDGKTLLVETAYEKGTDTYGLPSLEAVAERLYPGETKLVYTGPWVTGVVGMGFKQFSLTGYAAYRLRPIDVSVRKTRPRVGFTSPEAIMAGAIVMPKSGTAVKTTTVALVKPQPMGQDCGLKFNPESLGDPAQLRGFSCLLLTEDGQGTTLPDGSKLFRRYGGIEHWKGGEMIEGTSGLVARDAQGRSWFLEFAGWL